MFDFKNDNFLEPGFLYERMYRKNIMFFLNFDLIALYIDRCDVWLEKNSL